MNHIKTSKPTFFLTFLCLLSSLFFSCKTTPKELTVLYDEDFSEILNIAKQDDKVFCFILSKPNCPACLGFVQSLGERYEHLASKVVFNVVDVSQPENQWYPHWLCTGAFPTTCVFSSDGELQAAITGSATACKQCIASAITGDLKCTQFFENQYFPTKGKQRVTMLNTLISCKWDVEQGKDISNEIAPFLEQNIYPYPLFLKCLNEEKQGRHEKAVYWAKQMVALEKPYYNFVYNTLYNEAKAIINPNYAAEASVLSVVEELKLEGCELNKSTPFTLTLKNTGKSPLSIRNVTTSCTCVKLSSEMQKRQKTLQPDVSMNVDFVFTPDVRGDVFREITFFSDAVNSMQTVRIWAVVE